LVPALRLGSHAADRQRYERHADALGKQCSLLPVIDALVATGKLPPSV